MKPIPFSIVLAIGLFVLYLTGVPASVLGLMIIFSPLLIGLLLLWRKMNDGYHEEADV